MDADKLKKLLIETNYNPEESRFLVDGFRNGFDLGYRGKEDIQQLSNNLKFTIGDKIELWNKVMKEVEAKRYAGPFESIPFDHYIQSPIGLVPKDGGRKTRLIFHLSYPRKGKNITSINANTPEEMKKVKYKEFDDAVKLCLKFGRNCAVAKSDMSAAFRHFAIHKKFWPYLIMKAFDPETNKTYYFIDKCMPFGAAISCSHFQRFSDAISHIVRTKTNRDNINYLDDFFFVDLFKHLCNKQVQVFLDICNAIRFPVSMEKTFWGTFRITFLGLVLDTINQLICIPMEKINNAKSQIQLILGKKKIKLKHLQKLTGFLNFLCKAVVPGRAFTRRLYSYGAHLSNANHHLKVTSEMESDLKLWMEFLEHPSIYCRKFTDFDLQRTSKEIDWYTDASGNPELGAGGYSNEDWFIMQWDEDFIRKYRPSINYLELYAVTIAIINWIHKYNNSWITLFCDNQSVVHMVNATSSKCENCMVLIRMIVLKALQHNVKITLRYVRSEDNSYADYLSRMRYDKFRKMARSNKKKFKNKPTPIPKNLVNMPDLYISTF